MLAANDGLGNAVISALKQRKLKAIPVTGQDATPQGIQHILAGDQCMTVYKAVQKEADAAAQLAIALSKGTQPPSGLVNGKSDDGSRQVPSVLLEPRRHHEGERRRAVQGRLPEEGGRLHRPVRGPLHRGRDLTR